MSYNLEHINVILAKQHGVATERQIRDAGLTWRQQQRLVALAVWRQHQPHVIGVNGTRADWKRRAMAATLARGGARLSGPAAARLLGLDGFGDYEGVQIVVPKATRPLPLVDVDVRYSRRIDSRDRHVIDFVPTVIAPVALIQLYARASAPSRRSTAHCDKGSIRVGCATTLLAGRVSV